MKKVVGRWSGKSAFPQTTPKLMPSEDVLILLEREKVTNEKLFNDSKDFDDGAYYQGILNFIHYLEEKIKEGRL